MKQNLPYQILLAGTIITTGLALIYTVFLQESYSVTIRYDARPVQSNARNVATPPQQFAIITEQEEINQATKAKEEMIVVREPEAASQLEYGYTEKDLGPFPFPDVWEERDEYEKYEEYEDVLEYREPEEYEPEIVVRFPLNINEATYDQLILIPSVGDVTAQRILQYRDHLGGYIELEQLMGIKGIGQGTFDRIAPYLYVD